MGGHFRFSPLRVRKLSPRHHRGLFTAGATGGVLMAKVVAKRKKRPGRTDRAEFERFIEAARKRGVDETLEEFAARFRKIAPPKRRANDHPKGQPIEPPRRPQAETASPLSSRRAPVGLAALRTQRMAVSVPRPCQLKVRSASLTTGFLTPTENGAHHGESPSSGADGGANLPWGIRLTNVRSRPKRK